MFRTIAAAALILVVQSATAVAQTSSQPASCAGPVITSASVKDVVPQGNLNRYDIVATVVNNSGQTQSKDMLQFVDVYHAGDKLDDRGVPPLAAGQSYTVPYSYFRSRDAGNGTTKLIFAMDFRQGQPQCPGDRMAVTF